MGTTSHSQLATTIFLGFLALFLVRKIRDQAVSRRNIDRLQEDGSEHNPAGGFPLLVATHVVFFIMVPAELLWFRRPFQPHLAAAMIVLFVLATLLRWWSRRLLGESWNSQVVAPQDLQPVTRGPYRLIRHPNYLAMCLELLALSLVYSTYLSAAVVTLCCVGAVLVRIRREEDVLMKIPAYQQAMDGKARLIPGIY